MNQFFDVGLGIVLMIVSKRGISVSDLIFKSVVIKPSLDEPYNVGNSNCDSSVS